MDWPARTHEIQTRFFRTGPRTFLWLEHGVFSQDLLQWTFTFMDLGMCHTLSGHARVIPVPTGGFLVNKNLYQTEEAAIHAVFGNHYPTFVDRLYRDMLVDM